MLGLYVRDPAYRRFLKGLREQGLAPKEIDAYLGLGLYCGQRVDRPSTRSSQEQLGQRMGVH
jgi:hypothetical protein